MTCVLRAAICQAILTNDDGWYDEPLYWATANSWIIWVYNRIVGCNKQFCGRRMVAAWFHLHKNPHVLDSALSKKTFRQRWHHDHVSWITPLIMFILIGTLISLYIAGYVYWGIPYYQQLWNGCIMAHISTLLIWKLMTLNGKFSISRLYWFPTWTFLATFGGSILSAGLTAWAIIKAGNIDAEPWEIPTIEVISLGNTGSLSTVPSFAKECVGIEEKNPT